MVIALVYSISLILLVGGILMMMRGEELCIVPLMLGIVFLIFGTMFFAIETKRQTFQYFMPTSIAKTQATILVECDEMTVITDKVKIYTANEEDVLIRLEDNYNHFGLKIMCETPWSVVLSHEIPEDSLIIHSKSKNSME